MNYTVSKQWLLYNTAANKISQNQITLEEAANQAHYETQLDMIIRPISINNISYFSYSRRREIEVPKEFENIIQIYSKFLNCRKKVTYFTCLLYYPNNKFNYVKKIFKNINYLNSD